MGEEKRVDADQLLLLALGAFRQHTAEAVRTLVDPFKDAQRPRGVVPLDEFETLLKGMHLSIGHAVQADMLLDAQELSEMLGEQEGVSPQAFAAVCLCNGIDGSSMLLALGGNRRQPRTQGNR